MTDLTVGTDVTWRRKGRKMSGTIIALIINTGQDVQDRARVQTKPGHVFEVLARDLARHNKEQHVTA